MHQLEGKLGGLMFPPPLLVNLGVEIYFNPSILSIFSNSDCCFLQLAFSQTSESIAAPIFRSAISILKLFSFGQSDLKLDTERIGNASLSINLLSLWIVFLLDFDSVWLKTLGI